MDSAERTRSARYGWLLCVEFDPRATAGNVTRSDGSRYP